jgi:hypothetical protein
LSWLNADVGTGIQPRVNTDTIGVTHDPRTVFGRDPKWLPLISILLKVRTINRGRGRHNLQVIIRVRTSEIREERPVSDYRSRKDERSHGRVISHHGEAITAVPMIKMEPQTSHVVNAKIASVIAGKSKMQRSKERRNQRPNLSRRFPFQQETSHLAGPGYRRIRDTSDMIARQ